ncbi:MAG TPA: LLM class F420-dependent oxidoreductase [Acidimicrobiales bacterium]|nr:LLM class F420-dependent oxidoreductase [Acidimicrobiales bacterium]
MRVAIHNIRYDFPGGARSIAPTLAATARAAEDAGVAGFTLMDHWFQMDQMAPASDPMMEGYTTLGFLAASTESMSLSLLVTGVMYRHPGLLAKIVATLDVLSGGRAQLGIGAGWYEREHRALGVPFPPVAERFERLEETLLICRQMWGDDDGPFVGRHHQLAETICSPRPLTRPHPPLLIGGGGERKTLRLVARYADACNVFASSLQDVARKFDVLRGHCETEGRDPATVARTILYVRDPLADTDAFLSEMAEYSALGVSLVELMPNGDPVAFVERVGKELVPRLADLDAPG